MSGPASMSGGRCSPVVSGAADERPERPAGPNLAPKRPGAPLRSRENTYKSRSKAVKNRETAYNAIIGPQSGFIFYAYIHIGRPFFAAYRANFEVDFFRGRQKKAPAGAGAGYFNVRRGKRQELLQARKNQYKRPGKSSRLYFFPQQRYLVKY